MTCTAFGWESVRSLCVQFSSTLSLRTFWHIQAQPRDAINVNTVSQVLFCYGYFLRDGHEILNDLLGGSFFIRIHVALSSRINRTCEKNGFSTEHVGVWRVHIHAYPHTHTYTHKHTHALRKESERFIICVFVQQRASSAHAANAFCRMRWGSSLRSITAHPKDQISLHRKCFEETLNYFWRAINTRNSRVGMERICVI